MEGAAAAVRGEAVSGKQQASSYAYWVRKTTADAAPLPVPKKLSPADLSNLSSQPPTSLGSVWNAAGTWEEKNLNKWATERIKELILSVKSLEFSNGKAEMTDVSRCSGNAFLVTVRNKKRFGYTYELTIKVEGEWNVGGETRNVKGSLDIAEFSYGELDDLQMSVRISKDMDLEQQHKQSISCDLKLFLQPVREKLLEFERELRER